MDSPRLDDLAQRIEPSAGWDDLAKQLADTVAQTIIQTGIMAGGGMGVWTHWCSVAINSSAV